MKTVIVAAADGTRFRLLPDQMVEFRPEYLSYAAFRIDLREAWLSPKETHLFYTFPHVDGGRATHTTELIFGEEFVKIGCKTFRGENYLKLKAWALRGR